MKVPTFCSSIAILTIAASAAAFGQGTVLSKNNPYSPSPSGKVASASATSAVKSAPTPVRSEPQQVAFVINESRPPMRDEVTPVVQSGIEAVTLESPKPSSLSANIYRVGVGDVLQINLKNSAQGSGYYTVRENGVIDYPLAGSPVAIANKTTDEIAAILRSSIKLFADPQVAVKVQYYLSRSFKVLGLAENPGEKAMRREAMPVFAVRAESEVRREANKVKITRAMTGASEEYSLSDTATENILILAGDTVEFIEEKRTEVLPQYTFSGTKKTLVAGTKLLQAVTDALGAKAEPKYAIIRRLNDRGVTTIAEYEVKSIKKGKVAEPVLSPGDVVDVKN